MSKDQIIEKLKKGSLWIGIVCVLASLFNVVIIAAVFLWKGVGFNITDNYGRFAYLQSLISYCISTVIMAIAALMFFRIAQNGIPFTAKNARFVRIIGAVFLLDAAVMTGAAFVLCGTVMPCIVDASRTLVVGLLFLFIAHTIRYGAMLQQESDETL